MNAQFEVTSIMEIETNPRTGKHSVSGIKLKLSTSKNIDERRYFNEKGVQNADGCKIITATLVQSLVANIHYSHQKNYRDSAEHLRHIIAELEKGFVEVVLTEITSLT